jgi:hypothetical protein
MNHGETDYGDVTEAKGVILDLKVSLGNIHRRDPDEEVWERSYPFIDAALKLAEPHVGQHPVVREIRELFSPETVADGRGVRVAEVLPQVDVLAGILVRRARELALGQPGATPRRRPTGFE